MRKKLRVLVNSDIDTPEFIKFVNSEKFEVDDRSLSTIGNDDSADILSEYDAIILNYSKPTIINPIRYRQLIKFLNDSEKTLVLLMRKHSENQHQSTTQIIGGILEHLQIKTEKIDIRNKGENYILTEIGLKSPFKKYLNSNLKYWKISFESDISEKIIPLAVNSDNNIISFSLDVASTNYFLPHLIDNEIIFWETINEILQNKFSSPFKVDKWVEDYSFKKLKEISQDIKEIDSEIQKLEEKKILLEKEKNNYERIRNVLLNLAGDFLTDVCKEVLISLGLKFTEVEIGREDLVFIHNEKHYVIEVKGSTKSASKENVRQLSSHLTEYKNDKEIEPKGILLINTWRELPIKERNTNDKPNFPENIMNLVNLNNILLMTTQQLFVAYCDNLEVKFDLDEFIKKIDETKGVLEGYDDIQKYRIKT